MSFEFRLEKGNFLFCGSSVWRRGFAMEVSGSEAGMGEISVGFGSD